MTDLSTTIILDPRDCEGHDGHCDYNLPCYELATHVMLSATPPGCACGTGPGCGHGLPEPSASLAFVCEAHAALEPVASLDDAYLQAAFRAGGPAEDTWNRLLDAYPAPLRMITPETP